MELTWMSVSRGMKNGFYKKIGKTGNNGIMQTKFITEEQMKCFLSFLRPRMQKGKWIIKEVTREAGKGESNRT